MAPVVDLLRIGDGKVWSSQSLQLPVAPEQEEVVAARIAALDTLQLSRLYAEFIGTWTHGLVKARYRHGTLGLYLPVGGPALLVLSSHVSAAPGPALVASLAITGGLAVAGTSAESLLILTLALHRDPGTPGGVLQAEVRVEHYAPRLLALPLPRGVCRLLYSATQARLHRAITGAFVRELAKRITG